MTLQQQHGKEPEKEQPVITRPPKTVWDYVIRLTIVAMSAEEVIDGAAEIDRHYFRVTKQRINSLRLAIEELTKQEFMNSPE